MNATDKQKRMIHSLCRKCGIPEGERREMLRGNFGVNSTRDLSRHQASELIDFLKGSVIPGEAETELDKWRKRLIASIGGMLRMLHLEKQDKEANMEFIKAIACRASRYKQFNEIPKTRLQSLYNAFNNSQADLKGTRTTIDQLVNKLSLMN
jgi:hypothetical protein